MSSTTVRTGVDAYVDSSKASANYGSAKTLHMQGTGTVRIADVWFKTPVPTGSVVLSATLRLFPAATWSTSTTLSVLRLARSWVESHVNYTTRPTTTGVASTATKATAAAGAAFDVDVTSIVQAWANGASNFGVQITTTGSTDRQVYAFGAGNLTPQLLVSWSAPPDVPHTLSPDGGRAVSITKPVFRFDFHDVSGDTTLAAVQVQINHGSATFTAPTFDSGAVPASEPQLDLSTTTYAGTTAGTTAYWRVRVQDGSGLWSGWSDAAIYTKVNRTSAFSLDNPPTGSSSFVSEITPPITWTFGDGTRHQAAWQVRIINVSVDTGTVTHSTGKRTSTTANSYTLPKGVLTHTGDTYRVLLDIWDDVSRESTPGDQAAYEIVRDFVFAEDATPDPVTALTAAQYAPDRPWVTLTWSRSTAPDSFTVTRDGAVVASGLAPADYNTGSTSYVFIDRDAWPHATHTWKVQAVVNGKSSPSPTVSLRYEVRAVWLVDPDTDRLAPILVTDSADFAMPELGTAYEPVNSNHVVRIVQTMRGLEGTLSGRVQDYAGSSAATWITNLRWFKARPAQEFVLMIGAQSVRCVIGEVQIMPLAGGNPDDRAVSLAFWATRGW